MGSRRLLSTNTGLPRRSIPRVDRRTAELAATSQQTERSERSHDPRSLTAIVLALSGRWVVARRTQPPVPPLLCEQGLQAGAVLAGGVCYPKLSTERARIPPNTSQPRSAPAALPGRGLLHCACGRRLGLRAHSCDPTSGAVSTLAPPCLRPSGELRRGLTHGGSGATARWLHAAQQWPAPRSLRRQPALRCHVPGQSGCAAAEYCAAGKCAPKVAPGAACAATSPVRPGPIASPALALEPTAATRVPRAGRYLWGYDLTAPGLHLSDCGDELRLATACTGETLRPSLPATARGLYARFQSCEPYNATNREPVCNRVYRRGPECAADAFCNQQNCTLRGGPAHPGGSTSTNSETSLFLRIQLGQLLPPGCPVDPRPTTAARHL